MVAKADQARVRDLITETITLLCKNGLHFKSEFSIQALIGITLDKNEVFLVKIDETIAVSENGQSAVDCLLINTDVESDEDTRHSSPTTSKRCKNPKEYGYAKQLKPEPKCAYSTASHPNTGSLWQHVNSQYGTMHDVNATILTEDVEGNINASSSCAVNESLSSQRRNRCKSEAVVHMTNRPDRTDLDISKTLDSDNRVLENCSSKINRSGQGCRNGNALHPKIKQEPNADDDDETAYSFHAYQDQLLSRYNVADILHNQILQPHLETDQSVIDASSLEVHQRQIIQRDLIECNTVSHYQSKGGFFRRPGLGGVQAHRRRRLGGPVYRMPRNHVCNICGKAFEKKRDLRGHLAAKHNMEKEYKCDVCGKEFSYKRSLTDHMFVHAYNDVSMTNG